MVYYIVNDAVSPPVTYIMGKDQYENEELIKWGWPQDVWFHVDKLSSAHVYLRLNPGQTINDVPKQVIDDACQLVKGNSISGSKLPAVDVVYTMWSNLKKTPTMEVGEVAFFNDNEVRKVKVEKQTEILNRLKKNTKEQQVNLRELRERRDEEEKAENKKLLRDQKERERLEEKRRKEDAELRSYSSLMKTENMKDNTSGYDSDEFW